MIKIKILETFVIIKEEYSKNLLSDQIHLPLIIHF